MSGPLEGVRVVEVASLISGPLAAGVLADQGADVVKVERPTEPDMLRGVGPQREGTSAMFHLVNRGKRGVALDLKDPRGRDIFLRLVETADVVVENLRPGVSARLGVAYDDLIAVRPDLVHLSITGFGPRGPLSEMRVYDKLVQAVSGFAALQGTRSGSPQIVRNVVCDKVTAWMAAQAVSAALFARERHGTGDAIEISLVDAAVSFLWTDGAVLHTLLDDHERGVTLDEGPDYLARHRDGWSVAIPATDDEFRALCTAYGHPEIADDVRFAARRDRLANPEFVDAFDRVLEGGRALTVAEALGVLEAAGVPAVAVASLGELVDHPQIVANGTLVTRDDAKLGSLIEARPAARFGAGPREELGSAPHVGEHTDDVLASLGISAGDRRALRVAGVTA